MNRALPYQTVISGSLLFQSDLGLRCPRAQSDLRCSQVAFHVIFQLIYMRFCCFFLYLPFQGHFSVTLMNAGLSKEVARVPDGGEKSLNLYTVDINLAGM